MKNMFQKDEKNQENKKMSPFNKKKRGATKCQIRLIFFLLKKLKWAIYCQFVV